MPDPVPQEEKMDWKGFTLICLLIMLLPFPGISRTGDAGETSGTLTAHDLMPLEPRRRIFRIIEGERRGELAQLELTASGRNEGKWKLRLGEDQVLYLLARGGEILVSGLVIRDENKSLSYRGPVPLLPARIDLTRSLRRSTWVEIRNLRTGELEHSGPVEHEIESIARARFNVEAGTFSGYLVDMVQRIDLNSAVIKVRMEIGFVPGIGVVKSRSKFVTTKLLFFDDVTILAAELVER